MRGRWRVQRTAVVLVACGLVGAVVACRQIVGIDDQPQFSGASATDAGADASFDGGAMCGLAVSSGTCALCIETSCCDAALACAGDPACAAYETCVLACAGEPTCRSQCFVDHPVGTLASAPALEACVATSCEDACALGGCGGSPFYEPTSAATSCNTCVAANACAEWTACERNPECVALQHCDLACITPDCAAACAPAHATGLSAFQSATNATRGHCASDCAIGNFWSCVGHVSWPVAKGSRSQLSVGVSKYGTSTPASNVLVTLCNSFNPACVPEIDHATTALNGSATLTEPQRTGSVAPLTFMKLTGPGYTSMLYYTVFPDSEAFEERPISIVDTSTFNGLVHQLTNADPDTIHGHIIVQVSDCALTTSPGVTFTASGTDASTIPFYFESNLASTQASETDATGFGGFANVPPGTVTITATPKALGKASSKATVTVQAGWLTLVVLQPQP